MQSHVSHGLAGSPSDPAYWHLRTVGDSSDISLRNGLGPHGRRITSSR